MNGCQTCGGYGMHHDPIAHGTENNEPCMCGTPFTCMADEHDFEVARTSTVDGYAEYRETARKVIVLHMVYPDGTHTGDCAGCLWSQEQPP